ncbi:MAG: TIGR00725 family protein [Chloroflexi bacterium]|jgi:uncharacterized protein (TIGR00725 family)|nr:TIGR00725 family protein [Anaerolineaceae bacterium]NMB87965.1 TIGR00725 family protein [Chloroflexota bacterium]
MEKKVYIGVIGSGENVPPGVLAQAERIGELIAGGGGVLVCGGRGGVMEAACRGAQAAGGMTVGILPGVDREGANAYLDVSIPTGLGFALRNFITVRTCEAIIMLHGEVGTLSEAVLAYQHGRPLVALSSSGGWAERLRQAALEDGAYLDARQLMQIHYAETPEEAVRLAFELVGSVSPPAKI